MKGICKDWDKKEINFLKKNYFKMTIKNISKRLDRSFSSIYHKASRLNMGIRKYKVNIKKEDLYELYYNQMLSYWKIAFIYKCNPATICEKMKKFEFIARKNYYITKKRKGKTNEELYGIKKAHEISVKISNFMKENHSEDLKKWCKEYGFTDEIRKKMSEKAKGKKKSKEACKNMSIGKKKYFSNIKNRVKYSAIKQKIFLSEWNGFSVGSVSNQIRNSYQYQDWRKKVFEKDDYTCQICGIRSMRCKKVILNAHHIKKFSIIIKENNISTLVQAFRCKELWNVSNGKTLCDKCHYKVYKF